MKLGTLGFTAYALALLMAPVMAAKDFYEVNGLVSMEAENSTHGWKVIDGTSGKSLEDPGSGSATFSITFKQTGKYYVSLLAGTNVCGGDGANDVFVALDGQKLYGSDGKTRPDGIRVGNSCCKASSQCWTQVPKGPGSHTPLNIKNNPVYLQVSSAGKKSLKFSSRSAGFRMDKVVLRLGNSSKPSGVGPAETDSPGGSTTRNLQPTSSRPSYLRSATKEFRKVNGAAIPLLPSFSGTEDPCSCSLQPSPALFIEPGK